MNVSSLPGLRIVVLAAGLSSRLGRPKALAKIGATTLLRRTLRSVAGLAAGPIIVVLPPRAARYRAEARGFDVAFIGNRERNKGLSTSVRRGVVAARFSSAVLIMPMDLAALRRSELARLVSRWKGGRRRVVARRLAGGPAAGTPLIVPKWLYRRALEISGDIGLRELVNALPADQLTLVAVASAALDVDTPQDLARARRGFAASPMPALLKAPAPADSRRRSR